MDLSDCSSVRHVGILSIQGSQFQITEVPLKTVRPFEMDEVILTEAAANSTNKLNLEDKDSITAYLRTQVSPPGFLRRLPSLTDQVETLIQRARSKWKETHDGSTKQMMLPLIRLKVSHLPAAAWRMQTDVQVETTDAKEMTNPVRFGQDFMGRVATPRDILQYYRRKKPGDKSESHTLWHHESLLTCIAESTNMPDLPDDEIDDWEGEDPTAMTANDKLSKLRMANLVHQYLQAQQLEVLVENGLEDAVMRFVDKDDRDAIKE